MLYNRYAYAADLAEKQRVLEIACGPGLGLSLVGERATFLVGGDYDPSLLTRARRTHGPSVPLMRLDAQHLPLADDTFDLVLFFEASYYVPNMDRAFDELARVLAPGGTLVFVNANPERPDFIPSPLSVHYHSAEEFRHALESRGFAVMVEGTFPIASGGGRQRVFSLARRVARRLGLIPRTLAGRAVLKRFVAGRLAPLPDRLSRGYGTAVPRQPIAPGASASEWKVLYVTARL